VVDNDKIVGVLDVQAHTNVSDEQLIQNHLDLIREEFLVGADVSILEFVQQADRKPFRLLVTGQGISGLVSLSDVQQLPVRAALFAMITQLEMTLTELIRAAMTEDDWMQLLSLERREKVHEEMGKARIENNQVDPLLYTQFGDKTRIVRSLVKGQGYAVGEFAAPSKSLRNCATTWRMPITSAFPVKRPNECLV
jgi:hypothetical protein